MTATQRYRPLALKDRAHPLGQHLPVEEMNAIVSNAAKAAEVLLKMILRRIDAGRTLAALTHYGD